MPNNPIVPDSEMWTVRAERGPLAHGAEYTGYVHRADWNGRFGPDRATHLCRGQASFEIYGSPGYTLFPWGRRTGERCLYVSTGGFSADARYEADRSTVPLTLLTMPDLRELLVNYYESLDSETDIRYKAYSNGNGTSSSQKGLLADHGINVKKSRRYGASLNGYSG